MSKPRHNSRTKLCIELSLVHNRDNIEFYLHCKFQSLPFSLRRKNDVTDRQKNSTTSADASVECHYIHKHNYLPFHKHSNCRCIYGRLVSVQAVRNQKPISANIDGANHNSTGRVYNVQYSTRYSTRTAVCKLVVIVNGSCLIVWLARLIQCG